MKIRNKTYSFKNPFALAAIGTTVLRGRGDKLPHHFFTDRQGMYDAVTFSLSALKAHILMHPDLIDKIADDPQTFQKAKITERLTSLFGYSGIFNGDHERWNGLRRTQKFYFMQGSLISKHEYIVKRSNELVNDLIKKNGSNIRDAVGIFALDIVLHSLFGYAPTLETNKEIRRLQQLSLNTADKMIMSPSVIFKKNLRDTKLVKTAVSFIYDVFEEVCTDALKEEMNGHLASVVLKANGYYSATTDQERHQAKLKTYDDFLVTISAGTESMATTIVWLLSKMAEHPEWQTALKNEMSALGDTPPNFKDLVHLPTFNAIHTENLRLHPTLPFGIARTATQDVEICENMPIKKGDFVLPSIYGVQRNERWFPEPNAFKPERHLAKKEERTYPKNALIPFFTGAHACMGQHLVVATLAIFMHSLCRKTSIAPPPDRSSPTARFGIAMKLVGPYSPQFHSL